MIPVDAVNSTGLPPVFKTIDRTRPTIYSNLVDFFIHFSKDTAD